MEMNPTWYSQQKRKLFATALHHTLLYYTILDITILYYIVTYHTTMFYAGLPWEYALSARTIFNQCIAATTRSIANSQLYRARGMRGAIGIIIHRVFMIVLEQNMGWFDLQR